MADYDAIVCGGGSNGLAAAIRLAEAGWSVCLLEANDDLGGAARTLESTLPGFKHDFGAAFFPLVAPSPSIVGRPPVPGQPGDRPRPLGGRDRGLDRQGAPGRRGGLVRP